MIVFKNVDILNCKVGIEKKLNVAIKNGIIVDIYKDNSKDKEYKDFKIINCDNLTAVPSFVDLHVHFRDPGFEYKETVETGAMAAKAGGFTDVCCMANTAPVIDNEEVVRYILEKSKKTGINVYPVGAITSGLKGDKLTEFGSLVDAGVVAFSDDGFDVENSFLMKTAFEYANFFNVPIFCHSEDKVLVNNGVINDGCYSTLSGLRGNPDISESVRVYRNIAIAGYCGAKVHICHISSGESLRIVKLAQKNGFNVTAETCPHYLYFTDKEVYESNYNTNFKMNPPIRSIKDKNELIDGLASDGITCIATDHAPHAIQEKQAEFEYAPFGIIGLETAFAVSYQLVLDGKLTLEKLISKMSLEPAKVIGIKKNEIIKHGEANITLIDLNFEKVFEEKDIYSKSKNSPFIGKTFKGWPVLTLCKGNIVFNKLEEK